MDSIIDRRTNTYQLDADANRGFTTAVRNSQVRLALEYAVVVLHQQSERISKLEAELAAQADDKADAPRRGRRPRDAAEVEQPAPAPAPPAPPAPATPTPPPPAPPQTPIKEEGAKKAMAS